MIANLIKTVIVLLLAVALPSCGGGGSSSVSAPITAETTFDLGKYVSLTTGTSYTLTFTGTDTTGASYTGSEQCNVVGLATFEGKNVIQRNHVVSLIKAGFGSIAAGTVKEYFNADRTLYKNVYSNGAVETATNSFTLPLTVQPGNFVGQSILSSNGLTTTQTWQIIDTENNTASIVITSTKNQNVSEVDTLTVTTASGLVSVKQILYDFPSNGVTTTLNGTMN